ncbi:MAG: type II secretion system F family protein [Bacillota bacterium]
MFIILILAVLLLGLNAYVIFRIKDFLNPKVLLAKLTRAAEVAYDKRRIRQEAVRLLHRNNLKPSKMDLLEIKFIDKTNLRRILPFINLKLIVVLELFIVGVAFQLLLSIFVFPPTTLVMSFLIAGVPIMALDLIGRYNSTKVRRRLCDFVSCIGRWIAVKEDLVYAFEKSAPMMEEPLASYLQEMVVQIKMGVSPENALDYLALKIDNSHFKDFVINVKGNLKCKGDIRSLIRILERQFYEIEKEYTRRNISSSSDRILLYVIATFSLLLCLYMLMIVPTAREFYTESNLGRIIMMWFGVVFGGGTVLFSMFSKPKT